MQKFILFLDQPTYSFAIVLFTIFICSGLGSLLSPRLSKVLPQVIVSLGLLAFIYPLLLSHLFETFLSESLLLRLFISFGALAPLSFMMGIPFPWGIKTLGTISPGLVPWAWGINGCVSVVSSILASILALSAGFSWVLVAGGGAYLVGAGVAYHWIREVRKTPGKEQPA